MGAPHFISAPNNELAIIHALNQDGDRYCLKKALGVLVDKGMIRTYTDTNVIIYSLPENMRNVVLELAKLDMHQRQLLLRQPAQTPKKRAPVPATITGSCSRRLITPPLLVGKAPSLFKAGLGTKGLQAIDIRPITTNTTRKILRRDSDIMLLLVTLLPWD